MFGTKLKELRKLEGWTQEFVAKKIGTSKQTYSHYENENRTPSLDIIRKLAGLYQVDIDKIFGNGSYGLNKFNDHIKETGVEYITDINKTTSLPIVGNIACGAKQVVFEDIEGYEDVPTSWLNGGEYFLMRAKGDSMVNARILEGDLLIMRRQDDVDNGEIAAVVIDGEATLKRVYKSSNNNIVLQAENSNYEPLIIKEGEVRIVGKLNRLVLQF